MIRLICIDLDGTLLDDDKNIPEINYQMIRRAREEGIRIVLTSGRPPQGLSRYAEQLGLNREGEYGIAANGALLMEFGTQRILREAALGRPQLSCLLGIARQNYDVVNPQMYYDDKVLIERWVLATAVYERLSGCRTTLVPDLAGYLDIPMSKMTYCGMRDGEALASLQQRIEASVPPEVRMFLSGDLLLEFVHRDAGKWNAISALIARLGIQKNQVLCIGDNENDMDMVQEAGFGGCPSNACEALKACAGYVSAADNNHGGAADVAAYALGWA